MEVHEPNPRVKKKVVLDLRTMDCVVQCVSLHLMLPHRLQYFISVTVLAMVPELPEIVNGIQFALQNNISLRYEFTVLW